MTAKLHTGKCFVDAVDVGRRLRSINPDKVAALAESIDAIGLQQPISVWSPDDDTLDLVAGLHRLEAIKKLGWEEIDCIFVDMDDLDRQLWEIDENLMRADLSPAEMAEHTAKRAEVVRQKAELRERELSADFADNSKRGPKDKGQVEFVEDTAKQTGRSKRSVESDKARGEAIPADVLGKITGTDLDKGTYLDKLKKLSRDEQRERVDRDLEAGGREPKARRTTAEIRLDKFHHSIQAISRTCSFIPMIDVPDLDSGQRATAVVDLRNVAKQIQELIKTIQHAPDEGRP